MKTLLVPQRAFTRREREVCRLAASGFLQKEIAAHLQISVRTAETHERNIRSKLGVVNRAELIARLAVSGF